MTSARNEQGTADILPLNAELVIEPEPVVIGTEVSELPPEPDIQFHTLMVSTTQSFGVAWQQVPMVEDQSLLGSDADDSMVGGQGDDTLEAAGGNDQLDGRAGDDYLLGQEGDDTLDGGVGNDWLYGGVGNDQYLFGRDYGQDSISFTDSWFIEDLGLDVIKLIGVTATEVKLRRESSNLLLSIVGTQDQLLVENLFTSNSRPSPLQHIQFDDGTLWDTAFILAQGLVTTDDNDVLVGYGSNEQLSGLAGDDQLYGAGGDDTLDGGTGNDRLDGGSGNDQYLFGRGYGQDSIAFDLINLDTIETIVLGANILPEDVVLYRDLFGQVQLSIRDSDDRLTLESYDSRLVNSYQLRFANGTLWDSAAIQAQLLVATGDNDILIGDHSNDLLSGLDGNDKLSGEGGDDMLDGGTGNDWLNGGAGNDQYLFGRGYGQDSIVADWTDPDSLEIIVLGADILPEDVALLRDSFGQIELVILSGDDRLTLQDYDSLLVSSYQIRFVNGTLWDNSFIQSQLLIATADDDWLYGFGSDEQIFGLGGNDYLEGGAGNDSLLGGDGGDTLLGEYGHDSLEGEAGNDSLNGDWGNDWLDGGAGNDWLNGDYDNDSLYGGAGADTLYGSSGNDWLDGGAGNDWLDGGEGSDVYVFGKGFGQDTIANYGWFEDGFEQLKLAVDIKQTDVYLTRNSQGDLILSLVDTDDWLQVEGQFNGHGIDSIEFADGTSWTNTEITNQASATISNDRLRGSKISDLLQGLAGHDQLYGNQGDDSLDGGAGNDKLFGGEGNDQLSDTQSVNWLDGGAGDDILTGRGVFEGGAGNDTLTASSKFSADTYRFNRGDGQDRLIEQGLNFHSPALGATDDVLLFGQNIVAEQLWFSQQQQDLSIQLIGTNDRILIQDWYQGSEHQVEYLSVADGRQLLSSQVDALVAAMAAFTPPAAGETSLPSDYQAALTPVIASNWR